MIRMTVYDTIIVLLAFAEMVILALLLTIACGPTQIEKSEFYLPPEKAFVDETMHKDPAFGLKKNKWYEARIKELRQRQVPGR